MLTAGPDSIVASIVSRQQQWLLLMRHCARCRLNEHVCWRAKECTDGKQMWDHLLRCPEGRPCGYPHCAASKTLLLHHQRCINTGCRVCVPVNQYCSHTRP